MVIINDEIIEDDESLLVRSIDVNLNNTPSTSISIKDKEHKRTIAQSSISFNCINKSPLYVNFIFFCVFYSIAHGTVDAILAFTTSELGSKLGGDAGFALYITYTISALLFAKPALRYLGAKNGVLYGLCGLLCYVTSFFLAFIFPSVAYNIFIIGACIGGLGAGILWTSQGEYYSINATKFALVSNKNINKTIINFASIFAGFYLLMESAFKLLATIIFFAFKDNNSTEDTWKIVVFGIYAVSSLIAVLCYKFFIFQLSKEKHLPIDDDQESTLIKAFNDNNDNGNENNIENINKEIEILEEDNNKKNQSKKLSSSNASNRTDKTEDDSTWNNRFINDIFAVFQAILTIPKLQLLLPYQISFGFSASFIGYYINSNIISNYLGDGYIGFLSAVSTVAAVLFTYPLALIANKYSYGKFYIMIFGMLSFFFSGFPLLIMSDKEISEWFFLLLYVIIHGAGRGIWESTNKAVILEYFPASKRNSKSDIAFASIYFTSGLSGAIAYYFYQYMTRYQLAILNTIIPLISIVCYIFSNYIHSQEYDVISSVSSELSVNNNKN